MKLYRTGLISILGCIAPLIAYFNMKQEFNLMQPVIFWSIQAAFLTCIVIGLCYAYYTWDTSYNVSRGRLLRTGIFIFALYIFAWKPINYGWIIMVIASVIHMYRVRKPFN
jgi:uncharacterized membrane protein